MKMRHVFLIVFILFHYYSYSQIKEGKFGKISLNDFQISDTNIDKSSEAFILADVGYCKFEGSTNSNFKIVYNRHKRVLINSKTAYDVADVSIFLTELSNFNKEEIVDVQASTYNIDNGKILEFKLTKGDFKRVKIDDTHYKTIFACSNVKEGSIIEYSYTIKSDFLYNLHEWSFQDIYPTIFSKYEISVPEEYHYVYKTYGAMNLAKVTTNQTFETFKFSGVSMGSTNFLQPGDLNLNRYELNTKVKNVIWEISDMPALKPEAFTTSLKNYITRITFQLSEISFKDQLPKYFTDSWETLFKELKEEDRFGAHLSKNNSWMNSILNSLINPVDNDYVKAKKIFEHLRNNFTKSGNGIYTTRYKNLKDIYENKTGNVADINILLVAMLRSVKINASPIILSTRDNGLPNLHYPLLRDYNYVICKASIEGEDYYLDASEKKIGFNFLPLQCYNKEAKVIGDSVYNVLFDPSLIFETSETNVFLNYNKNSLIGNCNSSLGYYESLYTRDLYGDDSINFLNKEFKSKLSSPNYHFLNIHCNNYKNLEESINVTGDIHYSFDESNIVYLLPIFKPFFTENLLNSSNREYPVEFPFLMNYKYSINIDFKDSLQVVELPINKKIFLGSSDATFVYKVIRSGNSVEISIELQFFKSIFFPEEYQSLKQFFSKIIEMQNQLIVLKKK